jgi:hypothetical protein
MSLNDLAREAVERSLDARQSAVVSLYVVRAASGEYFAGFDTVQKKANFVKDPIYGKLFSNKYDIKLRPDEMVVELTIDLARVHVSVSEPFRPHRRTKAPAK